MTINTTANRKEYTGNGVTTAFSFPYYFLADADLVVIETVIATGVQTTKTLTTHYTVAGAGDAAGGTVTMLTAPASTVTLTIYRDPAATQGVDLVEGDPLPVETAVEQPLDRLTMIMQRVKELIGRALRLPEGDTGFVDADLYLPAKVTRASRYLAFDADGKPIASTGPTGSSAIPVSPYIETLLDDANAATARTTLGAVGTADLADTADTAKGDALVGHKSAGTNAVGRTVHAKLSDAPLSAKDFGAVGDGSTNDTTAVTDLVNAGNTAGKAIHFPPGVYSITPGSVPEIKVSILAPEAVFEARDATDSPLLVVNYDTARTGANSAPTTYLVDIGALVGSSSFSGVGTGLHVKQSARNKFIIRQTNWLKYGVHVDTTWKVGAPMPTLFENDFWIKSDSGTVGLQISTSNDAAGVPVDANMFYMGSSFNHTTACVRISAGTAAGNSDVHDNVFIHEMLEIGQTDSDGVVMTGRCFDNNVIVHNMRGVNGTGAYFRNDGSGTANRIITYRNVFDRTRWVEAVVGDQEVESGSRRYHAFGSTDLGTGVAAGQTRYFPFQGADISTSSTKAAQPAPSRGMARNFRVRVDVAPGAGQTFTFKLVKNGSASSYSIVISGTNTTNSDLTDVTEFAAGDTLDWEVVASAGAATAVCFASADVYL